MMKEVEREISAWVGRVATACFLACSAQPSLAKGTGPSVALTPDGKQLWVSADE
jgi:hypothetical protein